MIQVFKKIWMFSGKEQGNIKKSILIGFLNACFHAVQLGALYVVLEAIVTKNMSTSVAWKALIFMLVSILGKIVTQYYSQLQRTHAGYFMVAHKRLGIGEKLKIVPMGYFNTNSLGKITAIGTTILGDVENAAPVVLVTVLGGFLNSLVFTLALLFFDVRIGLVAILGIVLFLLVTAAMEKKSRLGVPERQKAQAGLVEAVLETIQGMSVVKAFNLDRDPEKTVDHAIDASYRKNEALEHAMTPFVALQQMILYAFSILILYLSVIFCLDGSMELQNALMMMVASFLVFEQLKVAGSCVANLRLTEHSIDRANEMEDVPVMEEGKESTAPGSTEITFRDVSFSYDKRKVLNHLSFTIPEKKMTAIVGPSGSGKSTLCRLIARFWDTDEGEVQIGGRDIRDSEIRVLMDQISIVFQNVYLFVDTIENNIKFGKPGATHEEVVEAAKKACCHDFIEALPDGYQTVISEGGGSLSGGQKQRISIARALIKNAPIVIFDEATANVDPENEDRLQAAIEELTRDKTVIMIAHRLKTVRNAAKILVLDQGELREEGTHEDLMKKGGIYRDFILRRKEAIGWKLGRELLTERKDNS